ncbi:Biosynthetic arginine decarboxylase [Coccomyxa sp. Obi]|nr:Biosynthetic arginine decarboxylase [Coccomyxa sp. Obi]
MAMVMVEKPRDWTSLRLEGGSTCAWQDLPCFRSVKAEAYGEVFGRISTIPDYTLKSAVASSNPPEVTPIANSRWSLKDSRKLYAIEGWGAPYFGISDQGHLCVKPRGDAGPVIDLFTLASTLKDEGLELPLLFRFPDIVNHRLNLLQGCFDRAVARYEYQGCYRGVFPVKCNHDRELITTILESGAKFGWGLEVGSKPELLMAMTLLGQAPGSLLICNGYKDQEYIELVVQCWRLGIEAVVVLEQFKELGLLLRVAHKMGVRPKIGVRAKLSTRHKGHWGSTSGEKAKFGLRPREIVAVVRQLATLGMTDCLQLLHFHIGSQITNIRVVKEAMSEAAYLYAELVDLGAGMRTIDCGGGLGIDYDGSNTDAPASLSYTMQNYANDVVCSLRDVCLERGIPMPTIVTESGRALASHHAVMVFDVVARPPTASEMEPHDANELMAAALEAGAVPGEQPGRAARGGGKGRFLLCSFNEVLDNLEATACSLREAYSDAVYFKEEALRAFKLGVLSLEERATVDMLFDATCNRILHLAAAAKLPLPEALQPSTRPHSATYHVNLSIFRSAPDTWAIEQVFPILPIHRLDEEPTVAATLADLTCDSDGKIDRFISPVGNEAAPVLPLHELRSGQPYLLAMFLTGVYQEVMGSAHNMFGSTHCVVVRAADCCISPMPDDAVLHDGEGKILGNGFVVDHILRGETMADVLGRSQHSGSEMLLAMQAAAGAAVLEGRMSSETAEALVQTFTRQMHSYTYLNL